ncbi:uncharacterized protein [Periplaneta americana]|uniref:uncharacterized protein n=1 Tax=Periplaneta americana TaxID=6978 RepID=UPI0037E91C1E
MMEEVIINSYGYKHYHEQFMQNTNGTTATEVLLIVLPAPFGIFLSTYVSSVLLYAAKSRIQFPPKVTRWLPFVIDFVVITVPFILCFTVYSDVHIVVSSAFFISLCVCVIYSCILNRNVLTKDFISALLRTPINEERRPYVTNFRAIMNLMTAVCILAVDFKIFPRRLAKTETFGYGLMDVGVGLFIIANAIVSSESLGYNFMPKMFTTSMWKALKDCIPLLLLGFARFFVTKQIDYQQHVSEYGVQWNFFITLAITKITGTLVSQIISFDYSFMVSVIILGIHQFLLSSGLQDWVLSNVPRENFLTANREGIISSLGYVALYFAGIWLGRMLRVNSSSFRSNLMLIGKLIVFSFALWLFTSLCELWFGVSRRLANAGYIIWILAFSITVLAILMSIELITLMLNKITKTSLNLKNHRSHEFRNVHINYVPLILEAINYNGLLFFLIANLLTGLVNICVHTLMMGVLHSACIICVYCIILCASAVLLYLKKIKVKM